MVNLENMNRYSDKKKQVKLKFYELFWIFVLGSAIGFLVETFWCYINLGVIESRKGLIYGPFTPVYGLGAVIFTSIFNNIRTSNKFIIFIYSAFIGGIFEYICSLLQEKIFGTISWEYSDMPLSIGNGRTSLIYCIFWGLLGVFFINIIYPFFCKIIYSLNQEIMKILTTCLLIFIVFDVIISCAAVRRQTERRQGVEPNNSITLFLDQKYTDDYLKKVYPNMKFTR